MNFVLKDFIFPKHIYYRQKKEWKYHKTRIGFKDIDYVIKKKIQSIKIDKVAYDEFIIVLKAKNKELRERNNSEIAILSMDLQKLRDKKEEYYDKKFTSEMSEDELKIFKKKNVKIFYWYKFNHRRSSKTARWKIRKDDWISDVCRNNAKHRKEVW